MGKILSFFTVILFSFYLISPMACGKGSDGKSTPKEGGSCEGIGAMEGKIACDGQKIIACSSYTKYKYIVTQTCSANQKCSVAPDGKSAACK